MRRFRLPPTFLVVVLLCVMTGGFFGRSALVAQDQISEQYKVLAAALSAIEEHYVDEAESDRLIYSALNGLMQTLDPHSNFMDPRTYAQTRERQEGRYYGVGLTIRVINGDITVFNVIEAAPAHRAGIRRGDVLAKIAGEDAKGWTTEQAANKLKGPKGTTVDVVVRRAGYEQAIDFPVTRDEVHMPTVSAALMIDDATGYVKLDTFGENTDREVGAALETLVAKGMTRLVFDLRGNPGGALDQAILVANRFLPRGSLIVYTRGRVENSAQDYRAQRGPQVQLPMITLVDRSSASASEIVSGALQDHDRSLIVGETTFGKALVQSVYRVSQGAGAAITTARYYTPSGRMIQRPWDSSFDEYLTYTSRDQSTSATHKPEDLKYTDAGRRVYSGGGVEPDRRFEGPVDGFNPTRFTRSLVARELFETYARRFAREGDRRAPAPTPGAVRELNEDFEITDAMLAEFEALVKTSPVRFERSAWVQDIDFIKASMQKEIDLDLFGAETAYRNHIRRDPQLGFALTLFGEAQQLLDASRQPRPVAQR
jgi:carboxyl-terminal processing protease